MTNRTRSTSTVCQRQRAAAGAEWKHAPFQPTPPRRLQQNAPDRLPAGQADGPAPELDLERARGRHCPAGERARRRVDGPHHDGQAGGKDLHLPWLLHGGPARASPTWWSGLTTICSGGRRAGRTPALAHQLLDVTEVPIPLIR